MAPNAAAAKRQPQGETRQMLERANPLRMQDGALWARIRAEAQAKLPVPLRGKPHHVAYKPALEGRINEIVAKMALPPTQCGSA